MRSIVSPPVGYVTVVSGLPRSGTSMMMQMLEAGGMEVLTDRVREADAHNPRGYYELERVRRLPYGDTGWLGEADGRAVKVVSSLLQWLPDDRRYRVLLMQRNLDEILASQERMLGSGEPADASRQHPGPEAQDGLREAFRRHLCELDEWLAGRPNVRVHRVDHHRLVSDPEGELGPVAEFLGRDLALQRMVAVVDSALHRQRGRPEA